ncbi:RusA family crossover junction endodeoxyribonuclease [Lacticaseibacillus rhamnosus]
MPQGRPRFTRIGRAYDPTKSRNYKQYVKNVASELNQETTSSTLRMWLQS